MLRWIGSLECLIIGMLCTILLGPMAVGLILRVVRGANNTKE